jgi:hypothetical protein
MTAIELTGAIKTLVQRPSTNHIIFIDGLDEFDDDCKDLVHFILSLSRLGNVKLCIASRPWLVFEEAFDSKLWLRLEDLTRPDIQHYVTQKLNSSVMFKNLEKFAPDMATSLIKEVTDKASGVFLWVKLVVESLLEGLRDGDRIDDLKARLNALPADLEELFRKILTKANPTSAYFTEASKMFQYVQLAMNNEITLSLLDVSCAHDGENAAISAATEPIPDAELHYRAETTRRQLVSRCKGLLEVRSFRKKGANSKVQYLHRTVRDFFQEKSVWDFVLSGTQHIDEFSSAVSLAASFLRRLKMLHPGMPVPERTLFEDFWKWTSACIHLSKVAADESSKTPIQLLDELNSAATCVWGDMVDKRNTWEHPSGRFVNQYWANTVGSVELTAAILMPSVLSSREHVASQKSISNFFEFAMACRLHGYVKRTLNNENWRLRYANGKSLMMVAFVYRDEILMDMLLKNGVSPEDQIPRYPEKTENTDETIWGIALTLSSVQTQYRAWWLNAIKALMDQTPRGNIKINDSKSQRPIVQNEKARKIIKDAFEVDFPLETFELLARIPRNLNAADGAVIVPLETKGKKGKKGKKNPGIVLLRRLQRKTADKVE